MAEVTRRVMTGERLKLSLIVWLAMVGFDFFLHGGVLAWLYQTSSPFLLPPARAFALIPLGYAAFLSLAWLLVWLAGGMGVDDGRQGTLFGLKLGALTWGALMLGLASITTAPLGVLLGWFVGQTLELALGGYIAGKAFEGMPLRRLLGRVLVLIVVAFILTVALQSLGLAPQTVVE